MLAIQSLNGSIFQEIQELTTGGIIWEVEGRGSGGKGVAYHTDSPTQVEVPNAGREKMSIYTFPSLRLGLVSLYDVLPPYYHSPDLPPPK